MDKKIINEESYSPAFKAELDKRFEDYRQDGKVVSREEMDKRINALLNNSSTIKSDE